ncbi:MAG: jacalin-like lectin [Chloroflexota bacterium]
MAEIMPVGGSSGMSRKDPAAGVQKVIAVLIGAGMLVDYIQMLVYQNGSPRALARHGGDGGHMTLFVLANDEYLTGITGRHGEYIDSLTLHTNKRTSPRFGGHGGEREYSIFAAEGDQIVGLWSRSDTFVNAIGVVTAPAPRSARF